MKFQDYQVALSFGYVYIIILGLLKEAFYYSQLGIDVLKYSTITDILISPISEITSSVTRICVFIVFLLLSLNLPSWLTKKKDINWVKKGFKLNTEATIEDFQKQVFNISLSMFGLGLMGFYVGNGIGGGFRVSKKIKEEKVVYEDKLLYINGKVDTVYLIGKNSSFLFYLPKDKKEIEVSPINNGMLKSIIEKR